jgi:hypothetical protein
MESAELFPTRLPILYYLRHLVLSGQVDNQIVGKSCKTDRFRGIHWSGRVQPGQLAQLPDDGSMRK